MEEHIQNLKPARLDSPAKDMSMFLSYDQHRVARVLSELITVVFDANHNGDWRVWSDRLPKLDQLDASDRRLADRVLASKSHRPIDYAMVGLAIKEGPKVFVPSAEQVESLQHVDLRLPLSAYRQPFPHMAVIFEEPSPHWPRGLLLTHSEDAAFLHCLGATMPDGTCIDSILTKPDRDLTYLTKEENGTDSSGVTGGDDAHAAYSTAFRVAINCMLLLVNHDRECRPFDPDAISRLHRDHRQYFRRQRDAWQTERDAQFTIVEFSQNVIVRQVESPGEAGNPTGRSVAPHWRRGHWRSQRHGKGLGSVKHVFIRPVLVRADRFSGSIDQTAATYRTAVA